MKLKDNSSSNKISFFDFVYTVGSPGHESLLQEGTLKALARTSISRFIFNITISIVALTAAKLLLKWTTVIIRLQVRELNLLVTKMKREIDVLASVVNVSTRAIHDPENL